MTQPKVGIDITANDRTARGVASAERRLGTIPKHQSAVARRHERALREGITRSGRNALTTLGRVEQASARVFGGRSITSGFSTRLGAIGEAAAATGTGLGEAAASGGVLTGTLGVLGTVAGATVGILAAAGFAAFKLADGWAKGAASIGRMADTMGVARREMQQFAAASERMGVDKGTATGGLAGLSQTLNDARYGRNTAALAVLTKMGVKMALNSDGTVDVDKMLPSIADAIARQNSSGRRSAAHALGLSDALIPVFAQGGKALSSDMKDADRTAYIASDADIDRGTRIQRKGAMVGQLGDRAMAIAGSAAATAAEPGYDMTLSAGRQVLGGATTFSGVVKNTFAPAAGLIDRGGKAIERGARAIERATERTVSGLTARAISAAQRTQARTGVRASITLAQYGLESSYGRRMPAGSNNPFGIKARAGEPYVLARTREEDRAGRSYYITAKFRKFANLEEAFDAHAKLLSSKRYRKFQRSRSVDEAADALTGVYATDHQYGRKLKSLIHRQGLDRYDRPVASEPTRISLEVHGLPAGTSVTATSRRGAKPAISHAVAR
ncbi:MULTISPECIES: glucosaminidase domain-containing protein [Sphingomonas]|uniref:glucosaminidase domain-containing protein n=1 Tax=Sphingomonas TaxID=13687 RepID=UPI00254C0687|nr:MULTISPECIES: glucosaminidase domain-containing protein [Sphingomonas]MDK8187779.1 glucosaminidase domain-containing protein [Sphingomonas zeae]MDK8217633.1 glucosaminidase domain-containing protein [Sphingomonas sp. UMB7805-LC452B]